MIISIDGPVASGKSTVARILASRLNMYYVSTGYLYRALAYILSSRYGYDRTIMLHPKEEHINEALGQENFSYDYHQKLGVKISFQGEDITPYLKTSEIDDLSSIISTNSYVRDSLLKFQRSFAENNNVIMEGRDIGSVILPNADIKFFLTASSHERANRWQQDQRKNGKEFSFQESLAIITERDRRDKNRSISPLIIPKNAYIIDGTELTQKETVEKMLSLIETFFQRS